MDNLRHSSFFNRWIHANNSIGIGASGSKKGIANGRGYVSGEVECCYRLFHSMTIITGGQGEKMQGKPKDNFLCQQENTNVSVYTIREPVRMQ